MRRILSYLNRAVAALAASLLISASAATDEAELEALFEGLKGADPATAEQIEGRIFDIWSQSGSDAMDLLLERGRDALTAGNAEAAVEHFSALIDHAPDFAEGYNARATAYFQLGLYGLSLADIRETLARNPRHFGAISGLAFIFEELGSPEGALAALRELEKLHPRQEGLADRIRRLEMAVEGATL